MSLVSREGAAAVRKAVHTEKVNNKIASAFYCMMNEFHSLETVWSDYNIEKLLLEQQTLDIEAIKNRVPRRTDMVLFNPSAAGKCPRELFYKNTTIQPDGLNLFPYNRRWADNGTAVHARIQRDLLYAQKLLPSNPFRVMTAGELLGDLVNPNRAELPAWENNVLITKEFCHNGAVFAIRGMCDGYLWYKGKPINLEIKTKSTTVAAVGTYSMKEPMHSHVMQCICYSILFRGDPYEDRVDTSIIYYESLAKDAWTKGAEARPDTRAFQINVTKEMRIQLLDKFAMVVHHVETGEIPYADTSKCQFCPYKSTCEGMGEC